MVKKSKSNVVSLYRGLNEAQALTLIRAVAKADDGRIRITTHAKQRMAERSVSIRQVFTVMACNSSRITEGPHQAPNGDWKCLLEGASAGQHIKLPLAITKPELDTDIIVITVIAD